MFRTDPSRYSATPTHSQRPTSAGLVPPVNAMVAWMTMTHTPIVTASGTAMVRLRVTKVVTRKRPK